MALLALFFGNSIALYFTSIRTSYCVYERWNASHNGTLRFEFRTSQSDALLLYMDDGGDDDYMEVVLEEGRLRFRVRIHNSAWVVYMGQNLDDALWHHVTIVRRGKINIITLDSYTRQGTVDGPIDELTIRTNLYVGGIPHYVEMADLSNSDAYSYDHFQGNIRNLNYKTNYSRFHYERLDLLARYDVDESPLDLCQRVDPCENKGLCVSNDQGPVCDCTGIDFEGEICEIRKYQI